MGHEEPERHAAAYLTEEQLEAIAERAAERGAERALTKYANEFFASVGRSLFSKIFWTLGALAFAVAAYLKGSGKW